MRVSVVLAFVVLAASSWGPAGACPTSPTPTEASLVGADELQRTAVVAGDVEAIRTMMHPQYRVNAPTNRVMTREEILAMFAQGVITAEPVQRTVEATVVSGTTGLVMGSETLIPPPGSELAKAFGEQPILRRFTNIYSFEDGRWWFIARHFSQVASGL